MPDQYTRPDRTIDLAICAARTACKIAKISKERVKNAELLRKRPFPNRRIPHVKKRIMKSKAKAENAVKAARIAMATVSGAAQMASIMSRPTNLNPYPSGGIMPLNVK